MSVLTILSDEHVKEILTNLTLPEVETLQKSMRNILHEFSTSTQDDIQQPQRTVVTTNGATTLFMPSTSASTGIAVKVVTLSSPTSTTEPDPSTSSRKGKATSSSNGQATTAPKGTISLMTSTGDPFAFINAEEVTAFRTALASSLLLRRRERVKRITVFGAGKQAYWHVRLSLLLRGSTIKHVYIVNRTFSDRARNLLKTFKTMDSLVKSREGWSSTKFDLLTIDSQEYEEEYHRLLKDYVRSADVIYSTTPSTSPLFPHTILTNNQGRLKGRLIVAIGSYTSKMLELPIELLQQAVTDFQKEPSNSFISFKHAEEGPIVVDCVSSCLAEAGEIIQAKISPEKLVELGELVLLRDMMREENSRSPIECSPRESISIDDPFDLTSLNITEGNSKSMAHVYREMPRQGGGASNSGSQSNSRRNSFSTMHIPRLLKKRSTQMSSEKRQKKREQEDVMSRWLSKGNVIYKSVGLGLMDLAVGKELVRLAGERGIGMRIENF